MVGGCAELRPVRGLQRHRPGVRVALEKGMRGREGARALLNCERENQMRGDNCFNALLLLNKSALQVGRKDFFFFFGCYLLKRTGERRAVWVDD